MYIEKFCKIAGEIWNAIIFFMKILNPNYLKNLIDWSRDKMKVN